MAKLTYLFYDIETTGLNPCFDQILQFAAIRTDLSLNEIERYETMIRINRDVHPSPEAMSTHGLSLDDLAQGENEYDAIQKIHRLVNKPGTISLGYNTLNFDDEFLRFSFYRNLLPPYTHQFANNCSRMDIYPMTLLYYLFKPNILEWPIIDGAVSLKLENINKANHFVNGKAHHAMVDVEATLALARVLHQEQVMWSYISGYFSKQKDIERLSKITEGIFVEGKLGNRNNFLAPALRLGTHNIYKNQWWLRLDVDSLSETQTNSIPDTTLAFRKKPGETPIVLPFEERFIEKLSEERMALLNRNRDFLEKNPELLKAITDYYLNYTYPEVNNVDVDAALYQINFPTSDEEALFREFHRAPPEKKQEIMALFPSPIRKEQALRIMGRHYPEFLTPENKTLFEEYLDRIADGIVVDFKGNVKKAHCHSGS